MRWFARAEPLPFKLGAIQPEELSIEIVTAVIATAWQTWHNAGCPDVPTAAYRGVTEDIEATPPGSLADPPDNLVVFVRTAGAWSDLGRGSTEIAVTLVSNSGRTGEIVDADIVVNDAYWRLAVSGAIGAVEGEVDFASVMTHEVGHALGMLHSTDPAATMYATYTGVEPSGARTLADDDRAGLCAAYAGVPVHVTGQRLEPCASGPLGAPSLALLILWLARRCAARFPAVRRRAGSGRARALSSRR